MMKRIVTRKDSTVESYHGTQVTDPYRWLEDPDSQETQAWVQEENALTADYLSTIPQRDTIEQRLTELWNYPKYSVPHKKAGRYFFSMNSGLQNQSVLYMQTSPEGESVVVIDPNTLSPDGTVALVTQALSENGKLLAYGTSQSGSDWQEIRIRQVDNGTDYPEVIAWCKFSSIAWKHDNSGFFYDRYPDPRTVAPEDQSNFSRVYWHTLNTPQSDDQLVYERPEAKELGFSPSITDDGTYLILTVWNGTDPRNRIYYRPVEENSDFVRLLDDADAMYNFIGNTGPLFYFHTDQGAPRGRIIAIDIRQPEREHWQELVPEQEDVISSVALIHERFVVTYMHDAHHQVRVYHIDGRLDRDIPLPALGSIWEMSGRPEDSELFLSFTSYLYPPTVYRYDFTTAEMRVFYEVQLPFDIQNYETRQVFYTSKDGTRIPMFLTYKKGLVLNGENPTLLYGYGGFNISLTPTFATTNLVWLEMGGIYAVANLRGGNEYGEEWHQAGMLERKQNVFNDFIAAAEWLIANKYTSTEKLAITGRSNGGLLVAACMVQRPDLYGAVVCGVPVIDMLRYHKFTVGRYWIPEYGNAESSPEHFAFLYAYSPLHNVKDGISYPPTLILSADTDDRVVPAHAKKFAARLQEANGGEHPILLRVETKAGHGLGKPTKKVIEEYSDLYAFLYKTLKM